jgi:large subunit ribosomal protein L24
VIRVLPAESRALVRGVNLVKRHQKQTPREEGGIITRELPIHISNIALAGADGKPTRVGFRDVDGRKIRYSKRTGDPIDG